MNYSISNYFSYQILGLKMFKLTILLCFFAFATFFENILAENDENVFKIALRKQKKFQRNAMNVVQNQKNAVDIVKLQDIYNYAYTTSIKLGNPPQELIVQIDTGSSDFWVYSPNCCLNSWRKCPAKCNRKNGTILSNCPKNCEYKFFPSDSNTFQPTNNYFNISYGDGSYCNGTMGKDDLQIGSLKIANTNFGMANRSSEKMEEDHFIHGIIGMGFIKLSTSKPKMVESPLFEAMNQKLLPESLFTVFMKTSPNGGILKAGGVLTIGGIDHENCGEIIGWSDVSEFDYETGRGFGFWSLKVDSVRIGNSVIVSTPMPAISDTGCSLVLGPKKIVNQIYDQLDIPHNGEIPCDMEYDPFVFKIAGKEYNLTKEMLTLVVDKDTNSCIFGMGIHRYPFWNLGDPFIRQYCHIYDMDKKRIGFAEINK